MVRTRKSRRLAALFLVGSAGTAVAADAGDARAPDTPQVHADAALGYALTLPPGWYIWPHHSGALMAPGLDPLVASCTLWVVPEIRVPDGTALDAAELTAALRASEPDYRLLQTRRAAFADTPVALHLGTYSKPSGSETLWTIAKAATVKGNTLYSVECNSPSTAFKRHEADMELIIAALRVAGTSQVSSAIAQPFFEYRSYLLQPVSEISALTPTAPASFRFRIVDDIGNTLTRFDTVHEKSLHLIVVRDDLAEFQHLHPVLDQLTGEFLLRDLTFPSAGRYRIFADFKPGPSAAEPGGGGSGVTAYLDVNVGEIREYRPVALSLGNRTLRDNDHAVAMTAEPDRLTAQALDTLSFEIRRAGQLVTDLEDYLGALGHTVIIGEGDLQYIHAHPSPEQTMEAQTGRLAFHVSFPAPGRYKAFFQFQRDGVVTTSEFVFDVAPDTGDRIQVGYHRHSR